MLAVLGRSFSNRRAPVHAVTLRAARRRPAPPAPSAGGSPPAHPGRSRRSSAGVRLWLPTQVSVPHAPVLRVGSDENPANTPVPALVGPQRESHLSRSSVEAHRVRQRSMNPLQTGKSRPSARFDQTRRMPRLARTRPHVTRAVKKSLQDTDSFSGGWNSRGAARRAISPPVSQAPRPPHAWPAERLSRAMLADPVRSIGQVRPASEHRRGGIAGGASKRQVEPPARRAPAPACHPGWRPNFLTRATGRPRLSAAPVRWRISRAATVVCGWQTCWQSNGGQGG